MYNILNSICFVNLYTELATVIRLAVVVVFFFFFLIWHPDVYNCHNNNNKGLLAFQKRIGSSMLKNVLVLL